MTMSAVELDFLCSCLLSCHNYLEFGSGNSTILAVKQETIKSIDSVESDINFIDKLSSKDLISEALNSKKLVIHFIDIGEVSIWGHPISSNKKHLWPNYSQSIFHWKNDYDLVLVDGRFRVSCILNTVLNTSQDCKILVHDFWQRERYHIVLEFLDTIKKADSFGLFQRKKIIDAEKIKHLINEYQYYPDDVPFRSEIIESSILSDSDSLFFTYNNPYR